MPGFDNPARRNPSPATTASSRIARSSSASSTSSARCRTSQRRQPQQHRDLRRRSARPGDRRVRHQREHRDAHQPATRCATMTRCACSPTKPTAAPSSIATISPRDEADHPRLERLLPARLQLDAGAAGRQVPRDQGAREAVGHAGPRAQGLLGAHRRGRERATPAPKPGPPPA